jgi:segregation and condensation protein B
MMQDGVGPERLAELEALLFASDAPLPLERIAEVLEVAPAEARSAIEALRAACEAPDRGVSVVEVGGGVRLVTRSEHAPVLLRLQRLRLRSRLSRAGVETLAIVAYRQPISRPEIEQLRGVGTESVLTHLLERRLIRVVGRKAAPGRPVLYGTTREFLEHFGLRDLAELPPFEVPPEPVAADPDRPAATAPEGEAAAGDAGGELGAGPDADDALGATEVTAAEDAHGEVADPLGVADAPGAAEPPAEDGRDELRSQPDAADTPRAGSASADAPLLADAAHSPAPPGDPPEGQPRASA